MVCFIGLKSPWRVHDDDITMIDIGVFILTYVTIDGFDIAGYFWAIVAIFYRLY